jgi:hypothetical protein
LAVLVRDVDDAPLEVPQLPSWTDYLVTLYEGPVSCGYSGS